MLRSYWRLQFNVVLLTLAGLTSGCVFNSNQIKPVPKVLNGVLDLRNWSLQNDGIVPLDGTWEFEWNRFVAPGQKEPFSKLTQVPGKWQNEESGQPSFPGQGAATYRIRILTSSKTLESVTPQLLGLLIPEVPCFELYINGSLMEANGKPSLSLNLKEHIRGSEKHQVTFFKAADSIEAILHVTNLHLPSGSLPSILLGSSTQIRTSYLSKVSALYMSVGAMILFGLFHLVLFALRPKETINFWLAIGLIFFALYQYSRNAPSPPFDWHTRNLLITIGLLTSPALLKYWNQIVRSRALDYLAVLNLASWLPGFLLRLLGPVGQAEIYFQYLSLRSFGFFFYYSAYFSAIGAIIFLFHAMKTRNHLARFVALGTLVIVGMNVLDTYQFNNSVLGPYLMVAFCLMLSIVIAIQNARARKLAETSATQLAALNTHLEDRIRERTTQLQHKTNDVTAILANLPLGVFTITQNLQIHREYSAYLLVIFGIKDVASDLNWANLLFDDSVLKKDQIDQCKTVIETSIGEPLLNFEFNQHLLIHEIVKSIDGQMKALAVDWQPILQNEVIEKVLVIVRDVTELKRIEAESERVSEELEIIGQILEKGIPAYERFEESSVEIMREVEPILTGPTSDPKRVMTTVLRNIHTIKGNSRIYNYKLIADSAHQVETQLSQLNDKEWNEIHQVIQDQLEVLNRVLRRYHTVYAEKLKQAKHEGSIYLELPLFSALKHFITRSTDQGGNEVLAALNTISMAAVLEDNIAACKNIANRLQKPHPRVVIHNGNHIRVSKGLSNKIQNIMTHILRNSLDHGIEEPKVRVERGKPENGLIEINPSFDRAKKWIQLQIRDDGQGLHLTKIKEKAVLKGTISSDETDDLKICNCIFESGVSTANEITEISGRGVGMEAVRSYLANLGGKIEIQPSTREGEFLKFSFLIGFPDPQGLDTSGYQDFRNVS